MTPSERRKPAASSRSEPGVRMITANGFPCSRTSRGSSVAARSSGGASARRPTRVTRTRRNGENESGMIFQPFVSEYLFHEIRADRGIGQPPFFFDREQWKALE